MQLAKYSTVSNFVLPTFNFVLVVVLLNIIPSCDESVVVKVELPLQTPFEEYADSYYEPEVDSLEPEVDSLDKKEQLEDEDEQLAKR